MCHGVKLNMNNSSALVTVAMLSALLNQRQTEYLDLISPFVLSLLPKIKGQKVNKEVIISGLKDKFGFEELPIHVLNKILNRSAKASAGYLKIQNHEFFVEKPYDSDRFEANQKAISNAQNEVIQKLQQYLQENAKFKEVTKEKARELLIAFLEKSGLAFVNGMRELKLLTPKDYDLFHVARFVLQEYEAKSDVFSKIEEVVRGFFIYKSIYYFSTAQKVTLNSKLKGTTFYLDTRLLIEALGYNTQEGKKAANELIKLVHSSGGNVRTFSHLKDEVAGILTKYARDYYSRPSMRLEYFDVNEYDEVNIMRLRGKLEESLSRIGIAIDTAKSLSSFGAQTLQDIKANELTAKLQETQGALAQTTRIDNDVLSVASIFNARNGYDCYSIENCKAVLVTSNRSFTQAVNLLYKESSRGAVSLVIDDLDITALLWLRSWDKKSNVPTDILLENAYAACQPSADLMEAFTRSVERLKKEDQITDEEALLLRTQMAPRNDLINLTQNDASQVTDSMVIKIKNNYASALSAQQKRTIDSITQELADEKNKKFSAIEKAEKTAGVASEKLLIGLKVAYWVLAIALVIIGVIPIILSTVSLNWVFALKVVSVLFGALGIIDNIRSRNGWVYRQLTKIKVRRFERLYQKELETINQYFG